MVAPAKWSGRGEPGVRPGLRASAPGPDGWDRQLVVSELAVVLAVGAAVALDGVYWSPRFVVVIALGLAATRMVLLLTLLRWAPRRVGPASTILVGVLAVAVRLASGAERSPVAPILMLALAALALRFPYRRALTLGLGLLVAYVLLAALTVSRATLGGLGLAASLDALGLFIFCGLAARAAAQRERYLRVAAHEVRNPLAAVAALVALLSRRTGQGPGREQALRTLAVLEAEIRRLSTRVDEVVEAFAAVEGTVTLARTRVDLATVLQAAARPFAEFDQTHPLAMDCAGPFWVLGDGERLEQVARNLLTNAVRYSPGGGGIAVSVACARGMAHLTVRDHGIGIPPDQLARIFDAFFRADNAPAVNSAGLGLGPFLCLDIVQRHRGRMWAENVAGGGAAFHVLLPLAAPAGSGRLPAPSRAVSGGHRGRTARRRPASAAGLRPPG